MCKSIILRCLWWIENYLVIYQQTFLYLYPLHLKGQSSPPPPHTPATPQLMIYTLAIYTDILYTIHGGSNIMQSRCSSGFCQAAVSYTLDIYQSHVSQLFLFFSQLFLSYLSALPLSSVSCTSYCTYISKLFLLHQSAVPLISVSCSSHISQLFLLYQSAVPLIPVSCSGPIYPSYLILCLSKLAPLPIYFHLWPQDTVHKGVMGGGGGGVVQYQIEYFVKD